MGFFSGLLDVGKNLIGGITGGDALGFGGSLLGGILSNQSNADIAESNRNFQAQMSDTSMQRRVQDLIAAGLSPMLAYSQGGASTPSGSTANMQDVITPAISSAQHGRKMKAEVANLEEQNMNIQSSTDLNWALKKKAMADATLSTNSAANANLQNRLIAATIPAAEIRGSISKDGVGRGFIAGGELLRSLFGPVVNSATSIFK